jgi:hypothetical protein
MRKEAADNRDIKDSQRLVTRLKCSGLYRIWWWVKNNVISRFPIVLISSDIYKMYDRLIENENNEAI